MSFEIKKPDFTVIKNINDWQPRPAIKEAMGHLCNVFSEAYPGAETGDTWVSFDNTVGRTTIFATPIDIKTPDGYHLVDRLVVKTVLPEGAWQLNDSLIVEANTMATTGALMVDPNTGDLVIVSSVTFLDCNGGDDGLQSIYLPLVSMAAVFHPYCLISSENLRQSDSETDTPYELEMSNEPSCWGEEDFKSAEMALRQAGICSNGGTTGLTAEFPWDDGGISWMTDDETSLLTFQTDMRHPHVGNGLFFKLELPDAYSKEQLVELVHYLNRLEVTGADVPPFFGAWCSHIKTRRIAYVGFLPNMVYWPGSVIHISGWLRLRSQTARATIGNFTFHGDHSRQEGPSNISSVK
jgi:hypothetical protein